MVGASRALRTWDLQIPTENIYNYEMLYVEKPQPGLEAAALQTVICRLRHVICRTSGGKHLLKPLVSVWW